MNQQENKENQNPFDFRGLLDEFNKDNKSTVDKI